MTHFATSDKRRRAEQALPPIFLYDILKQFILLSSDLLYDTAKDTRRDSLRREISGT